jgi:hypothetical protein
MHVNLKCALVITRVSKYMKEKSPERNGKELNGYIANLTLELRSSAYLSQKFMESVDR